MSFHDGLFAAKGIRVTILVLRDERQLRSLVDPAVRVVVVPEHRIRYAIPALGSYFISTGMLTASLRKPTKRQIKGGS
jgi:hypothetical protein